MKIQLPSYQSLRDVPKEMKSVWDNFGLLCEQLKLLFESGINFTDNIQHQVISTQLPHGVVKKIPHTLRRRPTAIIPVSNRAEFVEIVGSDASSFSVIVKLHTLLATSSYTAALATSIRVTGGVSFLREGDPVFVNGVENKVTAALSNGEIQLERPVNIQGSVTIVLAVSDSTFLLI